MNKNNVVKLENAVKLENVNVIIVPNLNHVAILMVVVHQKLVALPVTVVKMVNAIVKIVQNQNLVVAQRIAV